MWVAWTAQPSVYKYSTGPLVYKQVFKIQMFEVEHNLWSITNREILNFSGRDVLPWAQLMDGRMLQYIINHHCCHFWTLPPYIWLNFELIFFLLVFIFTPEVLNALGVGQIIYHLAELHKCCGTSVLVTDYHFRVFLKPVLAEIHLSFPWHPSKTWKLATHCLEHPFIV